MSHVDFQKSELDCKIVYYGPAQSGKLENLKQIFQHVPERNRSELIPLIVEHSTSVPHYMSVVLPPIDNIKVNLKLFTIPDDHDIAICRLILQQVDGIVFVADSSKERLRNNYEAMKMLKKYLKEQGKDIGNIPLVIQWNKRDVEDSLSLQELESSINTMQVPSFEAITHRGQGVFATLEKCVVLTLQSVRQQYSQIYPEFFASHFHTAMPEIMEDEESTEHRVSEEEFERWRNVCETLMQGKIWEDGSYLLTMSSIKNYAPQLKEICRTENITIREFYEINKSLLAAFKHCLKEKALAHEIDMLEHEKSRIMTLLNLKQSDLRNQLKNLDQTQKAKKNLSHNLGIVKGHQPEIRHIWKKLS